MMELEDRKYGQLNLLKEKLHVVNHITSQRMDSPIQNSSFCGIFFNCFFKITKGFLSCLGKPFCQTKHGFPDFITSFTTKNSLNLQKNQQSINIVQYIYNTALFLNNIANPDCNSCLNIYSGIQAEYGIYHIFYRFRIHKIIINQ